VEIKMLWFRTATFMSLLFLGLYIQPGILVEANGSIRSYEKKVIGEYVIGLGTTPASPSMGVTHFAAFVENEQTGTKYVDAEIEFVSSFSAIDLPEADPVLMKNSIMDPMYYEIDTSFNKEGVWFVMLTVRRDGDEVSVVYEVQVQEPNPIVPILTVGALLFFLAILSLSLRSWIKEYKRKHKIRRTS
jgi:hypothetical protein